MGIHNARRYIGDRLIRTAKPHRILDPAHGPLIAVKLNILTRKTLGGFETDLDARVFGNDGEIIRGSMRPARPPVSAAAACTATARWKARSSAAACSPAAMPAARRRRRRHDPAIAGRSVDPPRRAWCNADAPTSPGGPIMRAILLSLALLFSATAASAETIRIGKLSVTTRRNYRTSSLRRW